MPVKIRKQKSGCYKVSTPGGVKSKCTSKKNAEAQERIIHASEHGYKPTGNAHEKMRKRVMGS